MEPIIAGLSTFLPWLIDYTIDISILICLIFIIRSIASKKLPAWWHYSLWIVFLLRMIIPFSFESPLSIPNVVPISIDVSLFDSVLIEEDIITPEFTPELSAAPQGWNVQVDDLVLSLWAAGAIFFGIFILIKNIRFRNAIKKEPLLLEKRVLDLLEECKSRMRIKTPLQITVTDKIKSPALFGYIRPRLLLPVGVPVKLNDSELSYMFMHELGHLKRHDIGVSWLITFLQIFQWFNPFVWLAFYQMRLDQESACDASVLSRIKHDQTIDYASTIVGFLENFCRNHKLPALVGILENQTQIKKRITMIVNYRRNSKIMLFFSATLLIAIGVIFFSLAGFAKSNHGRTGLESSILQALPFEVPKELVAQANDVIHAKESVRVSDNIPDASVVTQEPFVEDKTEQDMLTKKGLMKVQNKGSKAEIARIADIGQKVSVASQERVDREKAEQKKEDMQIHKELSKIKVANIEKKAVIPSESDQKAPIASRERDINAIEQEKENLPTQKDRVVVQSDENNDEIDAVKLADGASAEAAKVHEEGYDTNAELKDIFKYDQSYKSEQIAETAPLSEKINNTGEDKSMQYMDFARSVYYISKSSDYSGKTSDLDEKKPGDADIHNLREVDEQPKIVSYCPPTYPFRARAKGIEGRVTLRFIVDKAGDVLDPQVISAEPEGVFEQAALDNVVKYKLKPAMKDGKSVNSVVKLAISFSLNDKYLKFAQR